MYKKKHNVLCNLGAMLCYTCEHPVSPLLKPKLSIECGLYQSYLNCYFVVCAVSNYHKKGIKSPPVVMA